MPACRQMSLTGTPASACLRIETIWVSVNRDFFMEPPGWGKHARKFYLWGVCRSGKLTLGTSVEALIGQPTPTGKRGPAPRIQQQLELVSRLPRAKQKMVSEVLDSLLAQAARG